MLTSVPMQGIKATPVAADATGSKEVAPMPTGRGFGLYCAKRVLAGCTTALAVAVAFAGVTAASARPLDGDLTSLTVLGPNAPIDFPMFPATDAWNADVSASAVHPLSATYLRSMGLDTEVHPDFGTVWNGAPNGIPYVLVSGAQPKIPITFYYPDESDPGPYPIPLDAPIEGGPAGTGDRHILTLDVDNRLLYEVYDARYNSALGRWEAGSGAIWNLNTGTTRPAGWTSADAAGLPMLPGLVRYDEVKSGEITHALRFTVAQTQRAYVYPATHFASDSTDPALPPMGLRLRLRAGYDILGFPTDVQVILRALKKHGMMVADNGGPFYISGAPDSRWDDDVLRAISQVKGSDFEVVDTAAAPPSMAAPVVSLGKAARLKAGRTLARTGRFSDAQGSAWTATVNYGDGRGTRRLALRRDKRFRLAHRYSRRGTYRITVRVKNDRGVASTARLKVVVTRR